MNRPEILEAARACVCGDREEDYGSPEDNFNLIAELWGSYMKSRCVGGDADVCFEAGGVANMMILLKVARLATGNPKVDTFVDIAGYAACGGEIVTKGAACTK